MDLTDKAENRLQAEDFYDMVTAGDYPTGRLVEACKTIYARIRSHGGMDWKRVHDRFHFYILSEKGSDPDLMLAFIKDPGTGPIFGSGCLWKLFSREHRVRPGIAEMQREGSAAFLANIPEYGKQSVIWDEKTCILYYSEAIPAGLREQYGLSVTTDEYRIDDETAPYSEVHATIIFNGKKYFY